MIEAVLYVFGLLSLVYGAALLRAFSIAPVTSLSLFVILACFVGFGVRRFQLRAILIAASVFGLMLGLTTWLEIPVLIIVLLVEHFLRTGLFLRRQYSGLLSVLGSWVVAFILVTIMRLLGGVTSIAEEPRRWLIANVWLLLGLSMLVLFARRIMLSFYRPTV